MATWRTNLEQLYRAPGGPGYSTLHFRHDGVDSDLVADLTAAQTALIEALANFTSLIAPTTTWRTSGVWQDVDGDREVTTGRATLVGTSPDQSVLPANVSLCLGWRTESRARAGRGRTFLSGWPNVATVDGTPSGNIMLAAADAIADLVNWNEGFANGSWVVYSRTDALARDITGGATRDVWASLRSRRD